MKRGAEDFSADIELRPTKQARLNDIHQLFKTADVNEIINKLQQMVTENLLSLEDLIYQIPEGPNQGRSPLYFLAQEVCDGKPEIFMTVWNQFKSRTLLKALFMEDVNGKSGLWCLAAAVISGKPEAFMAVWNEFKEEIPFEALLPRLQQGPDKGKSALWWLAGGAANGRPEAFLAVWEQFKDKLPLGALLAFLDQAEEGPDKGKSALFLLTGNSNGSDIFMAIWKVYKDWIPLEALLARPQEGPGWFVLWYLAAAACNGKPEAFMRVWDIFKDKLPLEALLWQVQEGPDKGRSVLWLLAAAALNGKPEAFMAVWDQFRDEITLEVLLVQAENRPHIGSSALQMLALAAQGEDKKSLGPILSILRNILTIDPKIILKELPAVKTLIDLYLKSFQELVTEEEELKALFALANIGQKIGYFDAFYDVSQYLESIVNLPKAFEAYELVSPGSEHYQKACLQCAEYKFAEATAQRVESLRNKHLKESLKWALQIQVDEDRLHRIRRIAKFYILGPTEQGSEAIISDEPLMLMKDKSEVDFCFSHFDEIKKQIEADKKIKAFKAKLQKAEQMNALLEKNNAAFLLIFKKYAVDEDVTPEPGSDRARPPM